ncbi:alpha-L-rhamnosidase [Mangrovibacterium diazotrophicum]|uniref:alpha-L-rhamnosidase n=1 Tax=Mangrovibacterium diazotrophicum TaxID=1261403 RepID=A0A419WAL2_9BACT|nr:alpha-L-rhamnosidase [Mangrovibacterium diazotrophicum]RKD92456.1 alpha-L-rhamnosidase [Mangrovibacterium diazotrophicum]
MRVPLILLLLICLSENLWAQTPAEVDNLRCEYLVNPLGVDSPNPRLSWMMNDASLGAKQLAYQLLVSTDSLEITKDKGTSWDSGQVQSDAMLVRYEGEPLKPFTKYFWSVSVWNEKDEKLRSPVASFETGMMGMSNWQGAWISDGKDMNEKAAPYFRKEFEAGKKIKSARVYVAAAGLFELYLNGEKVGDHVLDPAYTRFDRRNLYVTFDVTKQLQNGKNAIGILLGNGWYNHQSTAVWDFHKAPWRNRPTFCLDLRITYDDGTTETITSGKDWKSSLSPVIFNSIYTAEHYDARLEQAGWCQPGFNDSKWNGVIYRSAPSKNIVSQLIHPIRHVQKIEAKSMTRLNDSTVVFDLGRNIAGVSQITVDGPQGTVLRLKHGERLYGNGHVDLSNIDVHYRPTDDSDPFQTDIYILNGKGEETFAPHFNYKGFQYVEVSSSKPVQLTKESLVGYFMHSDVPPVGSLTSTNPTIDKIWTATNNSYLSNLFGYPTDCPQREKNGWTGDAHIAVETGLYSFDGITIYEKWLADHRDEQQPNGVLPSIIPTDGWGYEWGNGPDWTSTIALIPWNIYLFYGDASLLDASYDNIKRYVDHITEISPSGLTTWGLGDWVPVKSKSPVQLTSSCYYYADVRILAKAAKLLNKPEDEKRYAALAQKIKEAFNDKYFHPETNLYADGTQTEMSAPLYWGLVPETVKSEVAANLAKRVAQDQFHLDVGLLGQKSILNALSENGYADVAYKMASQENFPSWGWWIVNGATTLLENWDIHAQNDISMNHIMFGEIGAWLYKGLGGIFPDPNQPGFKNVILKPSFVSSLNGVDVSHRSPYGKITSAWEHKGKTVLYQVCIPANSTADFYVPAGYAVRKATEAATGNKLELMANPAGFYQLEAGSYQIELTQTR